MRAVGFQQLLGVCGIHEAGDLLLLAVDVDDGVRLGVLAQGFLGLAAEAAHAALDDASCPVGVQHPLEDVDVLAGKVLPAVSGQVLPPGQARELLKVVVLRDEAAAQVEGAHEAQGALACTPAADEHDGCMGLKDAFVPRRGHGDSGTRAGARTRSGLGVNRCRCCC